MRELFKFFFIKKSLFGHFFVNRSSDSVCVCEATSTNVMTSRFEDAWKIWKNRLINCFMRWNFNRQPHWFDMTFSRKFSKCINENTWIKMYNSFQGRFVQLNLKCTVVILGNSNFSQISAENYNASRNLAEKWNSRQNPANPNVSHDCTAHICAKSYESRTPPVSIPGFRSTFAPGVKPWRQTADIMRQDSCISI